MFSLWPAQVLFTKNGAQVGGHPGPVALRKGEPGSPAALTPAASLCIFTVTYSEGTENSLGRAFVMLI